MVMITLLCLAGREVVDGVRLVVFDSWFTFFFFSDM